MEEKMNNKMVWAFMMRISDHMWADDSFAEIENPMLYMPRSRYFENNNICVETWDKMVKFLADHKYNLLLIDIGDGVKFDSHPEISAPDAWSKEFLKKKLDEARALGLEVIPKLNFSSAHDTWLKEYRRMLSTPIYYKVCADLIAETCELFDYPRWFHLGLDEECLERQSRHEMIVIRQEKLYWHDANFLFSECEKHGARPWVWSDYYWLHPEAFIRNMSKEVIQSNWHYGSFMIKDAKGNPYHQYYRVKTYNDLDEMGFDQIPTMSSYTSQTNAFQTVAHGKNALTEEHILGYMTSPWSSTKPDELYLLQYDAHRMYAARRDVYPETLNY